MSPLVFGAILASASVGQQATILVVDRVGDPLEGIEVRFLAQGSQEFITLGSTGNEGQKITEYFSKRPAITGGRFKYTAPDRGDKFGASFDKDRTWPSGNPPRWIVLVMPRRFELAVAPGDEPSVAVARPVLVWDPVLKCYVEVPTTSYRATTAPRQNAPRLSRQIVVPHIRQNGWIIWWDSAGQRHRWHESWGY